MTCTEPQCQAYDSYCNGKCHGVYPDGSPIPLKEQIADLTAQQDSTNDPVLYYELELKIDALTEQLAGDGT